MQAVLATAAGRIAALGCGFLAVAGAATAAILYSFPENLTGYEAIVSLAITFCLGSLLLVITSSLAGKNKTALSHVENRLQVLAKEGSQTSLEFIASKDERVIALQQATFAIADHIKELERQNEELKAQAALTDEDHKQELANLFEDLSRAVNAANDGFYNETIPADYKSDAANKIATLVNDLITSMDRCSLEILKVISGLSEGDLKARLQWEYKGRRGELRDGINGLCSKLSNAVEALESTSGSLKETTHQIMSGANDLSNRTTKQAATIEETSAQMEQIAVTVMENAKRANHARQSAADASDVAKDGGTVMADATVAMERITQSASRISVIIGMIDDIVFQTNLLALNASVEAARAGEAGKGFAVVAAEVRRLAQSAAQASQEVKQLVSNSDREVKIGAELVTKAAENLGAIVENVSSVTTLMDEIAGQSKEQANSLEEVNGAVRIMDKMTQHNAALVQQTNAAIARTRSQFDTMDSLVLALRGAGQMMARPADAVQGLGDQLTLAGAGAPAPLEKSSFHELDESQKEANAMVAAFRKRAISDYQNDPVWQEF